MVQRMFIQLWLEGGGEDDWSGNLSKIRGKVKAMVSEGTACQNAGFLWTGTTRAKYWTEKHISSKKERGNRHVSC